MADRRGTSSGLDLPTSPREAVNALFQVHYRRLVGLASLMVDDRESAEEVVQDSFESLYRHWRELREPTGAVAYLNKSVVYGCRSTLRRRITARGYAWPEVGSMPSAETVGLGSDEREVLLRSLLTLPQRQREVMVLRFYLDLSEEQIADWLGISKGSVKQHASRATAALQKRLEAWA